MDLNLEIARDITAAMAPSFNGDSRLAALAFQRLYAVVKKYGDEEGKLIACAIVSAMGEQFKGNIDAACEAFERVMAAVVISKSRGVSPTTHPDVMKQSGTHRMRLGEQDEGAR
ncbi:MAG: hypothetical protein N2234_07785 [Planctomycetota bacterium]|nr:hypothetical protein [Planctomycetota bacterium]